MTGPSRYDSVVVGGGAAGLSAAMVLGRARRHTLLLDAGGQSNRAATHVGGLLGHDGTRPASSTSSGRAQVAAYEAVEFRDVEAVDVRATDGRVRRRTGRRCRGSRPARSFSRPA